MTPEQVAEQRAKGWVDFHPEDYCHRCGNPNIKPWYVDSALWNQAAEVHETLCPQCFVKAYEVATGESPVWRLAPAEQSDEKAALIQSEAAMRHERDRLRARLDEIRDYANTMIGDPFANTVGENLAWMVDGISEPQAASRAQPLVWEQVVNALLALHGDDCDAECQARFRAVTQRVVDVVKRAAEDADDRAKQAEIRANDLFDEAVRLKAELQRAADWHPHSAIGAQKLMHVEAEIRRLRTVVNAELTRHSPMAGDEYAEQRCRGCIAGYDPHAGRLVHAAYPCATVRALAPVADPAPHTDSDEETTT